jgi:hypothetical protein
MEWVHCHIARKPVPPCERLKNVPLLLSAIIMKMLAKTAEERYLTAAGVESDLQRCLADWETRGRIDEFPLGEHDTPDQLLIPEKLYGRRRYASAMNGQPMNTKSIGETSLRLVPEGTPWTRLQCRATNESHSSPLPPYPMSNPHESPWYAPGPNARL